ncbi:MAG: bifunctional 4-hydroxy-3-methylbut-2-enyl diphosphate reductase/30S ribosomal protein S1 [Clostridia bacterium]|nr:bifunctional 4-hydroxy-3-methylbut-2-enyl diphosphate reductase/30S ribosomal protein S1 [Clostridia bacterium]
MEIITAKSGGFCKGVKNAVDTAMSIPTENTYIYGEIVHNEDVVKSIEARGIQTVDDLEKIPDGSSVIIRSHGVGKQVYQRLQEKKVTVHDCTCAFVKRAQKIVEQEYLAGNTVVILGKKTHPEVVGLNGWCDNSAYIYEDESQDFSALEQKNVSIIVQTTFSVKKFDKIVKIIGKVCKKKVAVFKTICYTTIERQAEAEELAKQCDAMLVIGGLDSSNTNKLYEICKAHCPQVFRLKNAQSLEKKYIKNFKRLGIVTGASTPSEQTQEVLTKMVDIETEEMATTMEDVVAGMDNGQTKFKKGDIIKAIISDATNEGLQVLLSGAKKEILLDKNEVDCEEYSKEAYAAKCGEEIELMVIGLNPVKLSQTAIKMAKEEEAMLSGIVAGEEFSVVCTGSNKGGLTANFGTYSVFVPAREIRSGYVNDLTKYVGKKLRLKAIEVKTERRKEIIASQRVIIEAEKSARDAARQAKEAEFFANIHVDDVVEGKVERITDFGAFVSVNGFDCLAHISDLSWTGAKAVSDVLEIGQTYQFKVLKVDEEKKKVSIGYKQLQPQPWDVVAEKYAEGDTVEGKVVRIVPFGAFVEVEKGIDGLVHVSQISYEWLENPTPVLTIGQDVSAKILALDPAAKKMTLSIKALQPKPEQPQRREREENAEAAPKAPRKPRREPREVSDEMTSWKEDSVGGASIADLIGQKD